MTDRIEPFTPIMIDDIGAICRCKRYPGESQNDFLGRAILSLHETHGECARSLATADKLIAGFLKEARRVPVLGSVMQTCCAVVPLIPFMFLLGRPVVIYALWLGIVCLGPIVAEGGFKLFCRLRPVRSEPAEVERA